VSCAKVTLQLRITATLRTVSQEQLAAQRQDFGTAKETSFKRKVKVEKQSYLAKMTSAEQTKEERIENEQRLAEYKLTRRLSALEKKDAVKKSMMQSQRKLDSYRMQKIQAVSFIPSLLLYECADIVSLQMQKLRMSNSPGLSLWPWTRRFYDHDLHVQHAFLRKIMCFLCFADACRLRAQTSRGGQCTPAEGARAATAGNTAAKLYSLMALTAIHTVAADLKLQHAGKCRPGPYVACLRLVPRVTTS